MDNNIWKTTRNENPEITKNFRIQKRLNILLRHKMHMNDELMMLTQGVDDELQIKYRELEKAFSNVIISESKHLSEVK